MNRWLGTLFALGAVLALGAVPGVPAAPSPHTAVAANGWIVVAQADTSVAPNGSGDDDEGEEDENDVKIPPNLLEPEPADTTGQPPATQNSLPLSPADSGAVAPRGQVVPPTSALPETLRYAPPGEPSAVAKAPNLVPVAPKKRGGILGLTPAVMLLGLAVVHILVVKAVK